VKTVATLPRPITDYQSLSAEELFERTRAAKRTLGDRVMILGHNYQRDEVIQHADFRGDSLILAQVAEQRSDRPYVVFLRRALHGGNGRRVEPLQSNGHSPRHGGRLFHGRHGGD
jgi:hypothetical protein